MVEENVDENYPEDLSTKQNTFQLSILNSCPPLWIQGEFPNDSFISCDKFECDQT